MKPLYESLSDEQCATLIAEKMGYRKETDPFSHETCYCMGDLWSKEVKFLPNPWNPRHFLCQCFIFEEWLLNKSLQADRQDPWTEYVKTLRSIYDRNLDRNFALRDEFLRATADQRCKAFLITVGECR